MRNKFNSKIEKPQNAECVNANFSSERDYYFYLFNYFVVDPTADTSV